MHAGGQRFDSVILHHWPVFKIKDTGNKRLKSVGTIKFFDILEEVNKEEQTTIETLLALRKEMCLRID